MRCKFILTAVLVNLVALGGATRLGAQASAAGHAPETPPPAPYISETERVLFVMKGGEVFRNDLTPGTRGSQFLTR